MAIGAFGVDAFVHVGAGLPVAVKFFGFVAVDAGHAFFDPMHVALNALIFAEIFVADARPVTCRASVTLGRDFLERVSRQQTAA